MMLPAAIMVMLKPIANMFLGVILMNISFAAALIGLIPTSRLSNDRVLNDAFQLYFAGALLIASAIPLSFTEKFLKLSAYCH